MCHDPLEPLTKTSALVSDFFACLIVKPYGHQLHELKLAEEAVVILEVDDDMVTRGQQLLAHLRYRFII